MFVLGTAQCSRAKSIEEQEGAGLQRHNFSQMFFNMLVFVAIFRSLVPLECQLHCIIQRS